MLKYSKNFILCGDVDFFCLLCKESFEHTDQVEKHIRWEQHRKLIKAQDYLSKFRKDRIYKLVDKYYCEVCNYVTPSIERIKNHIKQDSHKAQKANPETAPGESFVRRELGFVILYKYALNKKEWHGIINKQCLICDTPVDNFLTHSASPDHMMGLIQAKVVKDNDYNIYRKIDEDKFYCFKCKKNVESESISDHFNSEEHTGDANKEKVRILFEINKENLTATCVVCDETILWSGIQLDDHRAKHIKKGEWIYDEKEAEMTFMQLHYQDKGKLRSDLKKYGRGNFIKLNEGGSKGYCSLCNVHISAHMRNFRQHVEGIRHGKFLELKGLKNKTQEETEKQEYTTKPFVDIYKQLIYVKTSGTFLLASVELCISLMSLTFVAEIDNKKVVCFVCNDTYKDWKTHITKEHSAKMFETNVVTSLKGEFVREISPGLFHCGVCNKAFAGWAVLEAHLKQFSHKYAKVGAKGLVKEIKDPSMLDESNCLDLDDIIQFSAEKFIKE